MAKRQRQRQRPTCRTCGDRQFEGEIFYSGFCMKCRDKRAQKRRRATATRLLSHARVRTIELDGQTFTVTVLPEKGRRIR